jgi:hypothetical protein
VTVGDGLAWSRYRNRRRRRKRPRNPTARRPCLYLVSDQRDLLVTKITRTVERHALLILAFDAANQLTGIRCPRNTTGPCWLPRSSLA